MKTWKKVLLGVVGVGAAVAVGVYVWNKHEVPEEVMEVVEEVTENLN